MTTTTKTGTYTPSTSSVATLGTSSAANKALQQSLIDKGANIVADGKYGPATAAAVAKYGGTTSTPTPSSLTSNPNDNPKAIGPNPIIKNQSNLVQSTASEKAKQNTAGVAIDNAINNTGTAKFGPNGEYTYNVDSKGVPYGDPIKTSTPSSPSSTPGTSPTTTTTNPTLPEGNIKDSTGNTYFSSMPENLTYKLPDLSNDKKWVFDASGKPFVMDSTGKVTSNPIAEQEYNTNIQKNKDIETQNAIYEGMKANISSAHQALIDRIKQTAQEQKTAMTDLNSRYLGSKKVAGFRTGSTEYTPEIAMGILKNEEEEGIRRIKEIDDKMTLALAEAATAKTGKDLALAKEMFDSYTKLQKEKESAIIEQYKMYLDNQKYIADTRRALDTEERAKKDQSMQELKASADGYVKGYASAQNKDAYVQAIATKLGLDKDIVLGEILNATPKPTTPKSTSTAPKTVNYNQSTIPAPIKDSILEDIKGAPGVTLQQIYDAYPEVSTTYLKSLFDSLKPKAKTGGKTS